MASAPADTVSVAHYLFAEVDAPTLRLWGWNTVQQAVMAIDSTSRTLDYVDCFCGTGRWSESMSASGWVGVQIDANLGVPPTPA